MSFTDYDPMAWLYATRWGGEFHEQGYAILNRLLFHRLPAGARILDVGCGDGRIAQQLSLAGFDVTGIDGSPRMLEFARERCPRVPFREADARDFTVDQPFDAAISTFDALNHILNPAELNAAFGCIRRALRPGGHFVFDLNREQAYTELWETTYSIVEPDVVCICNGSYDAPRRTAHADFTVFRPIGEAWERTDFHMRQYCHRDEDIADGLAAAGFTNIRAYDAFADLGMFGNIGRGRAFHTARAGNE